GLRDVLVVDVDLLLERVQERIVEDLPPFPLALLVSGRGRLPDFRRSGGISLRRGLFEGRRNLRLGTRVIRHDGAAGGRSEQEKQGRRSTRSRHSASLAGAAATGLRTRLRRRRDQRRRNRSR